MDIFMMSQWMYNVLMYVFLCLLGCGVIMDPCIVDKTCDYFIACSICYTVDLLTIMYSEYELKHLPDKARYVNMDKRSHQILTVKAVHDTTMSRDGVCKILEKHFSGYVLP